MILVKISLWLKRSYSISGMRCIVKEFTVIYSVSSIYHAADPSIPPDIVSHQRISPTSDSPFASNSKESPIFMDTELTSSITPSMMFDDWFG
jgi:hypothetical protein